MTTLKKEVIMTLQAEARGDTGSTKSF